MYLFNVPTALVVAVLVILLALVGLFVAMRIRWGSGFYRLEKPSQSSCYDDSYRPLIDAVIVLNSNKQFAYMNPSAEEMLGCKIRSVMGKPYEEVFLFMHFDARKSDVGKNKGRVMLNVIDSQAENACECSLAPIMKQSSISVSVKSTPILNYDDSDKSSFLVVLRDITRQKADKSKMSLLENVDNLTGMRHPKSFEAAVKYLIENSHKYNSRRVLVFFSIDQFQDINDSIGYSGSDNLIKAISGEINKHIRQGIDIVGRVTGGEFAVVFLDHSLPAAIRTIEHILKAVENCNFTSLGREYPTTMSAGFVIVAQDTTSPARAISEASVACSVARKRGGNILYAYKAENAEIKKLEGNLEWIMILKKAMQEDLFQMYAQPIHALAAKEYVKNFSHYELLIRLFDRKGNPISPFEFLSAAEYYSMMPAIDRWVVRNSLKQISKIPDQKPLPVFAINLSGQSLNDPRFLEYVIDEVKSSNVDPKMLCFEITEQVALDDMSLVNQFVARLRLLGSQFSLDDFGTGMSSYSYLQSLDLDYLKIDGSFVKNMDSDDVSRMMVQSISQVGQSMGLKIIAEYVENEAILEILRDMGVDYGQGYHILKPGPLNVVARHHMAGDK